jgi:hypothetical protein
VDVSGAGGRVEASSSGGGVTVRFAAWQFERRRGVLVGGSVRTEIDPGAKISIDATAFGRQRQVGRAGHDSGEGRTGLTARRHERRRSAPASALERRWGAHQR